ncbi:MAG TPA: hypothetical protein VE621_12360 [Bryobacteraceae bacterium]|nr:hypothetical protein [Bryobacteraceae bacterium]
MKLNRVLRLALVATVLTRAHAQTLLPLNNKALGPSNGFHIRSFTGSFGYGSIDMATTGVAVPGQAMLRSDVAAWASTDLSFTHSSPRSHFGISYKPSYSGRFQLSGLQSFNQFVGLDYSRVVSPKITLFASLTADYSNLEQYLFQTGPVTNFLNDQRSPDDIASLVSSGMAGLGGPGPAVSAMLYGTRVLSLSGNVGASYRPNSRWQLSGIGTVARTQARDVAQQPGVAIVPRTSMEQASLTAVYSLTPRTQLSVDFRTSKVASPLAEYTTNSNSFNLTRRLSQKWFASVGAGAGSFRAPSQAIRLPEGSTFIGQASLGYRYRGYSFVGAYTRNSGDLYGLASASTSSYSGSFAWRQRGLGWSVFAFGGRQQLSGGAFAGADGWQASAGVSKALGRQVAWGATYSYLANSFSPQVLQVRSVNAMRLSLTWVPFVRDAAPLLNDDMAGTGR